MENYIEETDVKPKRKKTRIFVALGAILGLVIGVLSTFIVMEYSFYTSASDVYTKMATLKHILDNNFLYDYDDQKLADYAAYGMTMSLEDPYTVYYPREEFEMFTDEGNGDFVGIGIVVIADYETDKIRIESVEAGSPAEKAGIAAGDILFAVDDEAVSATGFADAVYKVRGFDIEGGSLGKPVKITVMRNEQTLDFEIIREKLHTDSVTSEMKADKTGYIKISGFKGSDGEHKDTFQEFSEHFEKLQSDGMEKLIIDVRDNGGGELDVVANIIDMLVPEGAIMYAEYKNGEKDYLYSDENEVNIPMVVLVNGNSASASELLTGALKDYDKAEIVGTTTYGKGVMQQLYPLGDGSGLVITVAKYYTPGGTCVQETGITPDYIVEQGADEDLQLKAAMDILK